MARPEITKQLIANILKKLMLNAPLNKISIQDIVDACGINRKTFYYHFQDKQDLICWIFDTEFASLKDVDHNNTIIDELIEHLYANKNFYIAALTSDVQNNLSEHLYKIVYDRIIDKILIILGAAKMPSGDMKMIAGYFSNAITGVLTQWAREGMKTSPDEYSNSFYPITDECLGFFINKHYKK